MGCGISRPVMEDEATTQAGLIPIRRRIEEIKRNRLRSHKRSKSQLSTRDLLGQEDEESVEGEGRKSVSCGLESIREVQEIPFMEKMKRNDSNVVEKLKEDENEEEDEDEEVGNRLGDGPGSPSFREYCIPSSDESDEISKEESKSEDEKGDEKRRESIDSSEGSVNVLVRKKEHKGMRFRRVLPKGGQAAVKNLLNVKGCYCSNPLNHTNPRLAPVVPSS